VVRRCAVEFGCEALPDLRIDVVQGPELWGASVSLEEILEALLGWVTTIWELLKAIWDVLTLD